MALEYLKQGGGGGGGAAWMVDIHAVIMMYIVFLSVRGTVDEFPLTKNITFQVGAT